MSERDRESSAAFEARMQSLLGDAPAQGGLKITDPGDGMISARKATEIYVGMMKTIMEEWFGRGRVEGIVRERERIGRILGDREALRRRDLAMQLALASDKTAEEALEELRGAPRGPE